MKSIAVPVVMLLMMVAADSVLAQPAPTRKAGAAPAAPSHSPAKPRTPAQTAPPAPAEHQALRPTPRWEHSPFLAGPSTYAPRHTPRFRGQSHGAGGLVQFAPGFGYAPGFTVGAAVPPPEPHESSSGELDASGSLVLDVEPRSAQAYVDGFYEGIVDDFGATGLTLPAGRHWIELRASGYETLTVPVNISAGQPTRYRGLMNAVRAPAPPAGLSPVSPRGPETMYVIPGCYAGNRPPSESALARGCDIAGLRVRTYP